MARRYPSLVASGVVLLLLSSLPPGAGLPAKGPGAIPHPVHRPRPTWGLGGADAQAVPPTKFRPLTPAARTTAIPGGRDRGPALPVSAPARPGCAPHPPIHITEEHGDQGFTWTNPVTGGSEYRPGSGVVAGNGTADNPYLIQGWCITAPPDAHAILIEGTSSHVIIRANVLTGLQKPYNFETAIVGAGVRLDDTSNIVIADNRMAFLTWGALLTETTSVTIRDNTVTRIWVDGLALRQHSHRNEIVDNEVKHVRWYGVLLQSSNGNEVRGNWLHDNAWGGIISGSSGTTFAGNNISQNAIGLDLFAHRNTIEGNRIVNNRFSGIWATLIASRNIIQNNLLQGNGWNGIELKGESEGNVIRNNTLARNGRDGLLIGPSVFGTTPTGTEVHGNNFRGNDGSGLSVEGIDGPLNATDNWWGDASGPSGGVTDACTGTVADGSGERIMVTNATVCFDPWRTSPNPDAGVG